MENTETLDNQSHETAVFSFGEPTPVLDGRDIMGLYHSAYNGRYYEPPVNFDGLAKILHANVHHESALAVKTNIIASCFKSHKLLSHQNFKQLVKDHLVFGNSFIERVDSRLGSPLSLKPALAKYTRAKKGGNYVFLSDYGNEHEFKEGSIFHLKDPDVNQEIYGLPGYLAALQSALLNEASTLFRRKYYQNGSHAGFILYMTDPANKPEDIDGIKKAMKEAKGPGNFRNLFVYSPGGQKDGLKVIPIAEVAAKDEFMNIKNVTRDDVLAAHRVPPQLMGIVPNNTGGFGSIKDAAGVFNRNELVPLQTMFTSINDWIGEEVISFDFYTIEKFAGS